MPSSIPLADSSGPIFSSPATSNLLSSSSYHLSSSPSAHHAWLDGDQEASDETIVPSAHNRPTTPAAPQLSDNSAAGVSFFEEERRRLLWDISESLEMVLTHTNALNRNIEEWIRVRSLIDDSSELYDQFVALLRRLRLDGFDGQGEREGASEEGAGQQGSAAPPRNDVEERHLPAAVEEREPTMTGIMAPGGGSWKPQTQTQTQTSASTKSDITVAIRNR